ncbi:MAG: TerB family tellurite resistance protein [Lentisphaerales bacterium]|nr:TerB family tellurite resistance protein [Lentisphaerales bacterium]
MQNSLEFKLAKLLVAAAWADGDVKVDEINILKDLIFNLPGISGEDWQLLELYMDSPITEVEANQLLAEVMTAIKSASDKLLVHNTLIALIEVDGCPTPEEEEFIAKVEQALAGKRTNPVSMLGSFLKRNIPFKSQDVPKREQLFHDWVRNTVYYQVHHDEKHDHFTVDDFTLRKLCLKAGLLAKVIHQDGKPTLKEITEMASCLQEIGKLSEEEALILVEAALNRTARGLDFAHICRSYFEVTEYEERCDFLLLLFRAAASSDGTCHDEIETIRGISIHLKVPKSKFVEAKLTVFPDAD